MRTTLLPSLGPTNRPRSSAASTAVTPSLQTACLLLAAAFAPLLSGCDAGKEPFTKAAQAEEAGDYKGAVAFYEEVCTRKSPLCDAAKKREARLAIKAAWKAFGEGNYKDAKSALDAAAASADTTTSEEATALLANPDLVQGLAFEAASAEADKVMQMKAIETIAEEPTVVAAKAKEWLDKNRPAILLAQAKTACVEKGSGSCAAVAKKLAATHPESPEAKEAAALAAENYKRLYPKLKEVENLLIQRVMVHDKEDKLELCKKALTEDECNDKLTTNVPALGYLEKFFNDKLALVDDPHYKTQFEKRWNAAAIGEYDPEPWPKP